MADITNSLQLRHYLSGTIFSNLFLKISLSNYRGNEKELKNIYIRKVKIKRKDMLSFTYRYKTKDIFKNFPLEEGIGLIVNFILSDFNTCTMFTTEKEIIIEYRKNNSFFVKEQVVNTSVIPNLSHNKEKQRLIKANASYLYELNITDKEGKVFNATQDKYKQINQYIQILSSLIKEVSGTEIKNVVDMGSGKGYLTFALYDYLHNILKQETQVWGIEYRSDMVELCNDIARKLNFNKLNFEQGTIEDYNSDSIDLLIALHACDTATDDAIYKGIKANAKLIVVAPCCHKQIRKEIEKHKAKNDVSFLTKYGIFLERQAEMITDGIRALILEYFGYKTKIFEFISDAHTPKNVLVVGIKSKVTEQRKQEIHSQIVQIKASFGIKYHHLENVFE